MNSPRKPPLPKNVYSVRDSWNMTPVLAQAMPRLETNTRLTHNITELMPSTLKSGWRAQIDARKVILRVPHQALAVKIKQQEPLLIDGLKMYGWDVDHIVTKVSQFNRPEWIRRAPNKKIFKNQRVISDKSANRLMETLENLEEDSPIRAGLEHLLATYFAKKAEETNEHDESNELDE